MKTFTSVALAAALILGGIAVYTIQSSEPDAGADPPAEPAETTAHRPADRPRHTGSVDPFMQPVNPLIETPAPPERPAAADVEDALSLLPPDTTLVLWTNDFAAAMNTLDIASVLREHAAALSEAEEELAEVGLTLMDFVDPTGVGIDPAAPVALAVLGLQMQTGLLAARISDANALRSTIATFIASLDRPFKNEVMDDAEVWIEAGDSPQLSFVIRGGQLFVLASMEWMGDVSTATLQIAYQEEDSGLPTTEAWQSMISQLHEGYAWGFVNMPAILAQVQAELDKSLAGQRAVFGTTDETNEWMVTELSRLEGKSSLANGFLGSINAIGGSLDLDGTRVVGNIQVALAQDSLLRGLVQNRSGYSALQKALDEMPLFLLDGKMDRAAMRRLTGLFASSVGADLEKGLMMVKTFGSLEGDLFDVLSGEIGIAVGVDDIQKKDPIWTFTMTVGVADVESAQTLIDRLGGLATLAGVVDHDEATGGVKFNSGFWRTLHLALVNDTVVLTTEPDFMARLSRGGTHLSQAIERPDLSQLMGGTNNAGSMLLDFMTFAPGFRTWHFEPAPIAGNGTPESNEVAKEINALNAELFAYRKERDEEEKSLGGAMLELIGTLAIVGRMNGGTLEIDGGLYHNAPTARDLVKTFAASVVAMKQANDAFRKREEPLETRLFEAQQKLSRLKGEFPMGSMVPHEPHMLQPTSAEPIATTATASSFK